MRFPGWTFSLALLGALFVPWTAGAVTIDATALTSPTFRVFTPAVLGPYPTNVAQNLALGAGTYVFSDQANGAFSFDVDGSGLVSYSASFENFLDGAGTTTLTVVGFDITVDARTLTSPQFWLPHITGLTTATSFRPSDTVLGVTVLPNDCYAFGDNGSNFVCYNVDYDGNVQVPAGAEDYLQGDGTPNLVVRGFDFTIDARPLTSPTFSLGGITGLTTAASYRPTSAVLSVTGIPGTYDFRDIASNDFLFDIDADGFVRYNAAYEPFLDGAGTTALVVPGFTLSIDVRGMAGAAANFNFSGFINPGNSSVVHTWIGIPGGNYAFFTGIEDALFFTVDLAGHYQGLPAIYGGFPATGNGTTLFRIGGNDPPSVTITGPPSGTVVAVGTAVVFTGAFTDEAGDTHTALWTLDGVNVAGSVNETAGTVTASHTFTQAGVYFVTLTVTDNGGESGTASTVDGLDAIVVVYDPSGGFVTGGGWIDSPAGAYVGDISLVGRANFGFVSKYKSGATTPTGQTEFQFKVANFSFRSTVYDWLVVAGPRAQYKGSGTINGAGDYGFMLTGIDGSLPGGGGADKFRIKIWDKGSGMAVYDNQISAPDSAAPNTMLGGGSIVIHKNGGSGSAAAIPGFEASGDPLGFALHPHSPNPTRNSTVITFTLPSAGRVRLAVYDAAGREVAALADGAFAAGRHAQLWNGRDRSGAPAGPGIYFVRLESSEGRDRWVATRKLTRVD